MKLQIEIEITTDRQPHGVYDTETQKFTWSDFRINTNKDLPLGIGDFTVTEDGVSWDFKNSEIKKDDVGYYIVIGTCTLVLPASGLYDVRIPKTK